MAQTDIAIVIDDQEISYRRFASDVALAARHLNDDLNEQERHLAITVRGFYWQWVLALAVMKTDKTAAAVPPQSASAELANHFDVCIGPSALPGVRVVDFSATGLASLATQWQVPEPEFKTDEPLVQINPETTRWILTSGTTGRAKIVSVPAAGIMIRNEFCRRFHRIDMSTRFMPLMGIGTAGGFFYPLATWLQGGCVYFDSEQPGPGKLGRKPYIEANLLFVAPATLKFLLDQNPGQWVGKQDRRVITGGSRLHKEVRDKALAYCADEVEIVFGATEVGGVAVGDAKLLDEHKGSVGYVMPGSHVQVVDQSHQSVSYGTTGMLRCQQEGMAEGYENGSGDEAFRDGWFYPGDNARLYEDGQLIIAGRTSDVLNIGGNKISAVDLETHLQSLSEIDDLCAVKIVQAGADCLAFAVVCAAEVDLETLRKKIAGKIKFKGEFLLVRFNEIPRNNMGKLPRKAVARAIEKLLKEQVDG